MPNILLIEDDVVLRNLYIERLSFDNLEVDVASNVKEAYKKINKIDPYIIVLDISLPIVSGYKLIEDLALKNIIERYKIIIFTATPEKDKINTYIKKYNLAGYFEKSSTKPRDLVNKIKVLLKEGHEQRNTRNR